MNLHQFSQNEIDRAVSMKEEQLYRNGGYKKAVLFKRSFLDYENHLFAFLIDLNICLLPVFIWAIEFLLIMTGLIPPVYFDLLFYVMYGLLFFMSCVVLPLYTASTKGQTFGMKMLGMRLVRRDKKPASAVSLVLCELLGTGVPLVIFGYFFSISGLLIYWMINMLVILFSPHQQSIADWIFNLVLVYTPEVKIRLEEESRVQKENVQHVLKQAAAAPVQTEAASAKNVQTPEKADQISPIDLHIRSNYSDDGSEDVEEIMKQAKAKGLEVISITDHNCARANFPAVRFANMYNIQYIPGVEIDAQMNGQRVRILGYYIDWNQPIFSQIETDSLKREKEASIQRVKAFEKLMGIRVDIDSILSRSRFQTITPSDLTYMVFKNEKTRKLDLIQEALKEAGGNEEAAKHIFKHKVFGKGGECEVVESYPDAKEMIQAIHDANGLAVLAGWKIDELQDETLEGILDAGIDGLEAFTPGLDKQNQALMLSLAGNEKLFVTAGSDFHGKNRPERKLGVTTCPAKGLPAVRIFTKALQGSDAS